MKISVLHLQTSREGWVEEAQELYQKKIKPFVDFEILTLKSKSLARENFEQKIKAEEEQILSQLRPTDLVWLLDEKGRLPAQSPAFSKQVKSALESAKPRLVVILGGAFGVGPKVRERAQLQLSLSPLTFNHHLARVVFLEQLYRALTILKGIPYHN